MINSSNREAQGKWAEARAAQYLADKGLILLDRNFRTKMGEIDLIMQEDNMLVFVEVRYRKTNLFGSPVESVDRRKQIKLIKTAECYLASHKKYARMPSRFDVVGISNTIEWIRNAFGV